MIPDAWSSKSIGEFRDLRAVAPVGHAGPAVKRVLGGLRVGCWGAHGERVLVASGVRGSSRAVSSARSASRLMMRYQLRSAASNRPFWSGSGTERPYSPELTVGSSGTSEHDPANQCIEPRPGEQRLFVWVDRQHGDAAAADPPLDRQQVRARLAQRNRGCARFRLQDRQIERSRGAGRIGTGAW